MNKVNRIKEFAKRHTFKFVVIILLTFAMLIDVAQSTAILYFNKSLKHHKQDVKKIIEDNKRDYELKLQNTANDFNNKAASLNSNMDNLGATLNARMDTLGSAIDPESKRRSLVKTIRDAIVENTDRTLSIGKLNEIANAVIDFGYEQNLPFAMVLAQMKQESDFNPTAISHAQAKGLMQILDHPQRSTADEIAGELGYRGYNIWHTRVNVRFGCFYMRKMLTAFNNNYEDALRAYNFGPHRVLEVKAGDIDYSLSKVVVENEEEISYLVNKYGEFELDENGNRIEVKEEHKYPRETRNYVKNVKYYRSIFAKYGLDKVE